MTTAFHELAEIRNPIALAKNRLPLSSLWLCFATATGTAAAAAARPAAGRSILIIFSWSRECKTRETSANEEEEQRICLLLLCFAHLRLFRHVFYHVSWFLQHDNCLWMTTLQPVDACKQASPKEEEEEGRKEGRRKTSSAGDGSSSQGACKTWYQYNYCPCIAAEHHPRLRRPSSSLFVHECSTSLSFFFVHLFAGVFFVAPSKSVGWL
jgi:hypothetical protein